MKLFDELTDENFEMFAVRNYYNPTWIDPEEFYHDLKRFTYIKRLLLKYEETANLSINLLLNHLVVIMNVFGYEAGLRMLEHKIEVKYYPIIKPFLIYLKVITNDKYIGISMDNNVVEALRKL